MNNAPSSPVINVPSVDQDRVRSTVRKDPYNKFLALCLVEVLDRLFKRAARLPDACVDLNTQKGSLTVNVNELLEMRKHIQEMFDAQGGYHPRTKNDRKKVKNAHILYDAYFIQEELLPVMSVKKEWDAFINDSGIPILPGRASMQMAPLDKLSRTTQSEIAWALRIVIQGDICLVSYTKGLDADMDPVVLHRRINGFISKLSGFFPLEKLNEIIQKHYKKSGSACLIDLGDICIRSYDDLKTKEQRKPLIKAMISMTMDVCEFEEVEAEMKAERRMI